MRCYIDCVHCYLKQAATCMGLANIDEDAQHRVLYELMDDIKGYDRENSPAVNSSKALLKTYELIKNSDPYKEVKKQSNDLALALYPRLKEYLNTVSDRLHEALKISVAGNVIDLGPQRDFDVEKELDHSLRFGFTIDHYEKFIQKLESAKELLFLGDNAGEIVFDKILVEEIRAMGKKVTYVVKEGPVLNDATMEDAVYVGMDKVAKVITNGTNYLGTCLDRVPAEFLDLLRNTDIVISKGQANFESLDQEEMAKGRIFFILKVKCENIAKETGVKLGDVVFFTM